MKLSAAYVVYDDYEFLPMSLESIYNTVDKVYFMLNTKPWRGEGRPESRAQAKKYLEDMCLQFPKCELVEGTWDTEEFQRNVGLKLSKKDDCKFQLIIDTDEVYNPPEIHNLRKILENNLTLAAIHCTWVTYWKVNPLYRVEPRESFNPLICANVDQFMFYDKRSGITCDEYGIPTANYHSSSMPPHVLLVHHFSYARSDEFIGNKIKNFSHSHEILNNWYEDVWLKWKPGNKNFHPVVPNQYHTAVQQNLFELPMLIQRFFKNQAEISAGLEAILKENK